MKTIVIGCDNAATDLKKHVISILEKKGIPYEDIGANEDSDEMYPDVAARAAKAIIASSYEKEGILVCGTGIGMAITANKFPGIYAAVCHDIFSTERARLSNDTNVMTMGARIVAPELATKMVEEWLSLKFIEGSSSDKVNRIKELEKEVYK